MHKELRFKNLPFTPVRSQMIYIENEYDEVANKLIKQVYRRLAYRCQFYDMEFVYIPYICKDPELADKVQYYAPYLTSKITDDNLPKSNLLISCLEDKDTEIEPSFIRYSRTEGDVYIFDSWNIKSYIDIISLISTIAKYDGEEDGIRFCEDLAYNPVGSQYSKLQPRMLYHDHRDSVHQPISVKETNIFEEEARQRAEEERKAGESWFRRKLGRRLTSFLNKITEDDDDCGYIPTQKQEAPSGNNEDNISEHENYNYLEDLEEDTVEDIMDDLQFTVKRLQLRGITLAAIHEMIDKREPVSRLVITSDYHIFLPDFNNMEIEMGILPKTVFLFFLRYPEGVVIKTLPDHLNEIKNIYKELRPKVKEEALHLRITELTNPTKNKIHENIARIRAAFVKMFDEHLAKNYFITGEPGKEYRIPLDRTLEIWTDLTAEEWKQENRKCC